MTTGKEPRASGRAGRNGHGPATVAELGAQVGRVTQELKDLNERERVTESELEGIERALKETKPHADVIDGRWRLWHKLAVLAIIGGIAAVGVLLPRYAESDHAGLIAWLVTLVLLVALGVVIGRGSTGLWRGIVVDSRNRVALSRVQVFAWTAVVLSAYASAVLGNIGLGATDPLGVTVPDAMWIAMGLSTATFVGAGIALSRGSKRRNVEKRDAPDQSRWTDMVMQDEDAHKHSPDLGKIQLAFVTLIALLVYCVAIGDALNTGQAVTSLPATADSFLILLALSQGGYLAKKSLPASADAGAESAT